MKKHPRVFISYSHIDRDRENMILSFANRLRHDGIDANVDLYEEFPPKGWPKWTENQIAESDYVLVVNDKTLFEKINGNNDIGKGAAWEIAIIYQFLYDKKMNNEKFIPILFDDGDFDYILAPLKSYTYYNITKEEEYNKLFCKLCNIQLHTKPPLGELKELPQKIQKTVFFQSPIDITKWDHAKWCGTVYLYPPNEPPILGLLFDNIEYAKEIFASWKKVEKEKNINDYITVSFIVRPFPQDSWILSKPNMNYGNGYFIHVGPNINKTIERNVGMEELITISRFQWMDENEGLHNKDVFKKLAEKGGCYLAPVSIIDKSKAITIDNLYINEEYFIKMNKVFFKEGINLENDLCSVVLKKPYNE